VKKHILITGICFSLLLSLFLSNFQISFNEESYYEVSSKDDEYDTHGSDDEQHESDDVIEVL